MPPLYIGTHAVDKCYRGGNEIDAGLLGANEVCGGGILVNWDFSIDIQGWFHSNEMGTVTYVSPELKIASFHNSMATEARSPMFQVKAGSTYVVNLESRHGHARGEQIYIVSPFDESGNLGHKLSVAKASDSFEFTALISGDAYIQLSVVANIYGVYFPNINVSVA